MKNFVKLIAAAAAISFSAPALAGALIVSGDEWQLSNNAYSLANADTSAFAAGIASEFGGTNYLLLTGNGAYMPQANLASLSSQLTSLGKTVSYANSLPGNLSGCDAVFHFGQPFGGASSGLGLDTYLAAGGSVFLSLGGGYYGSAAGEANYWNPFLNTYGLNAGSSWGPIAGFTSANVTVGPAGQNGLIWGYGQTVDVLGGNAASYVKGTFPQFNGQTEFSLVGISRIMLNNGVPEPATWAMMIIGFGFIGGTMRRRIPGVALG